MAVAFRSAVPSADNSPGVSGLSAQANDIIIAIASTETDGATWSTVPSEYTLLAQDSTSGDLGGGRPLSFAVYWARRGGSDPGDTWSAGAASAQQVSLLCYSGAKTSGDPFNVVGATTQGLGADTTIDHASITTTVDNCMIIGLSAVNDWQSGSSTDFSNERIDGGATMAAHAWDDGLLSPAGATGVLVVTAGGGWGSVMVALEPDTGVAQDPNSAGTRPYPHVVESIGAAITTSQSPSVTFTVNPAPGDWVVLFPSSTTTATITEPSGWLNPLGAGVDVESDAHQICCVYHQVTAAESAAGTKTYTATNLYDTTETGYVHGHLIRSADPATLIDTDTSTFDSSNTVTPHVFPAVTPGVQGGLVLASVAKDATGAYSSVPGGMTQLLASNTNQGRWTGYYTALGTKGTAVGPTNITPSAGDEYASIVLSINPVAIIYQPPPPPPPGATPFGLIFFDPRPLGDSDGNIAAAVLNGAAALAGDGELVVAALVTNQGAAALAGDGALAAAGLVINQGAAALAGDGSLTVAGTTTLFAAANLTGDGSLTAAAALTLNAAAALEGDGALTAAAALTNLIAAALEGDGALTAAAVVTNLATAALAGDGALAAAGLVTNQGAASLAGDGSLDASAAQTHLAAAALAGDGALAVAAVVTKLATVDLAGDGSLTAAGLVTNQAAAALEGDGALTTAATQTHLAAAALAGDGSLQASVGGVIAISAALAGDGSLTAAGLVTNQGAAALAGDGALAAAAVTTKLAVVALAGDGSLAAASTLTRFATVALAGDGALSAATIQAQSASAALAGDGSLTVAALSLGPEPLLDPERLEVTTSARLIVRMMAALDVDASLLVLARS